MECASALNGHAVIGDLLCQGMLERVFGLRKAGAPVQELNRLKRHEAMHDVVFCRLDNGLQES